MGGAVCQIIVKATLKFSTVPSSATDVAAFDKQMREVYGNPEFAQSVVNDTDDADAVCTTLAKATWTAADRTQLLGVINEICGGYPPS